MSVSSIGRPISHRCDMFSISCDRRRDSWQRTVEGHPGYVEKIQVQSTIPTSIRHGPHEYGGLELYDLRTEAAIESLKYCRDALYSGSETGKLMRPNLHASQREAGIGPPLLQHPDIHVPYLTPTWILSLRQFLYCQNMSLTVTDAPTVKLRSTVDQYIMQKSISLATLQLNKKTLTWYACISRFRRWLTCPTTTGRTAFC